MATLEEHRRGVMQAAHEGNYPNRSLPKLERHYQDAIRKIDVMAHACIAGQQAGVPNDPVRTLERILEVTKGLTPPR